MCVVPCLHHCAVTTPHTPLYTSLHSLYRCICNVAPAQAGWLEVVRQVPQSWAEKLRLAAWPQLVGSLPDDWVERLGAEQQHHYQQPAAPAAATGGMLPPLPAGLQDLLPATLAAVGDLVCALGVAGGRSGGTTRGVPPAAAGEDTQRLQRLLTELLASCPGGSSASRMGALQPDVVARWVGITGLTCSWMLGNLLHSSCLSGMP